MAGQANIVSFDEVRSAKGASRPSVAVAKKAIKRPVAKPAGKSAPKPSVKAAGKSSGKPTVKPKTKPSATSVAKPKPKTKSKAKPSVAPAASRVAKPAARTTAKSAARTTAAKTDSKPVASKKATKSRSLPTRPARDARVDDHSVEGEQEARQSKLSKAKRDHAKAKAGKAFTKQFGETSATESSAGGARAALYKGEMGRKHKQATRMQDGSGRDASARKRRLGISFNPRSPKFIASAAVAVCLVISCMFLYPTAKQYYVTARQHDQLEAEYEALQARNAAIQTEVNALSTDEGIEDRARREFGWVKEDERAVNVYGLDGNQSDSTYNKAITPGSVEAPDTWYSPLLDTLFGVQ